MERASAPSRSTQTRTRILTAAIEQIAVHGYDAVRLRDIARAAGVSIGLIQHHFDTRDELLGEAFEHHCAQLIAQWRELTRAEPDPWRRIVALVDHLAGSPVLDQRARQWAEFCIGAARHPDLALHLGRIHDAWRLLLDDAVSEGTRSGQFTPVLSVGDVAQVLVTQIDGSLLAVAGGVGEIDGPRLRELAIGSAEVLLGLTVTAESSTDHKDGAR